MCVSRIVVKLNCKLPQKCTLSSQESQSLWGRRGGGWSGRQEEAISNPEMSFTLHEYRWKHHETAKTVEETCGNGEESGGNEGEDEKGPLTPTSAEEVSSFEDIRYFCFYKINSFNLCRLGTFGETARLHSKFGGRGERGGWKERGVWRGGEREGEGESTAGHLSHMTNKADITPHLF